MNLYNTPIEAGIRSLIIISTDCETDFDIGRIVYYDYFILYPSDAPNASDTIKDVQSRSPYRSGELAIKREIIQAGIGLLTLKGLVNVVYKEGGVFYKSTPTSAKFLAYFESEYVISLKENARSICHALSGSSIDQLEKYVNDNIVSWGTEFTKEALFTENSIDYQ